MCTNDFPIFITFLSFFNFYLNVFRSMVIFTQQSKLTKLTSKLTYTQLLLKTASFLDLPQVSRVPYIQM